MVDLYLEIQPLVVGKGSVDSDRFNSGVFLSGNHIQWGEILNCSQMDSVRMEEGTLYSPAGQMIRWLGNEIFNKVMDLQQIQVGKGSERNYNLRFVKFELKMAFCFWDI